MKTRFRLILILFLVGVLIYGFYLSLKPTFDIWRREKENSDIILDYRKNNPKMPIPSSSEETVFPTEPVPQPYAELWSWMEQHNRYLYESDQTDLADAFSYSQSAVDLSDYGYDSDVFGILTIPALMAEVPIRLGASWDTLGEGAAHLTETSYPIGGINTNAVIAEHRRWNFLGFKDWLDLHIGDNVYVQNPWETLQYQVVEILVIEPTDREAILIQPGKDMISLITCHPIPEYTHRLLFRCERIPKQIEKPQ